MLAALARVAPEADLAGLDAQAPLRQELELDSMDFLSFLVALQRETGVEVPEADAARLHTLADGERYLSEKGAA